jgi:hypothetical protein
MPEPLYKVFVAPEFLTSEELENSLNAWAKRGYRVISSSYRPRKSSYHMKKFVDGSQIGDTVSTIVRELWVIMELKEEV